jgi:hypothetical protein
MYTNFFSFYFLPESSRDLISSFLSLCSFSSVYFSLQGILPMIKRTKKKKYHSITTPTPEKEELWQIIIELIKEAPDNSDWNC